ncbi:MAG TPA: CBS domain-containing protein [Candidatus Dormibacteraeota bacterium]|nr:CBS domain-containing protein [Candidatus Dormibacteraeota bacterium]
MAAGLPTEGTNTQHPRAADVARKDVPTSGLKERLGEVRDRVRAAGWDSTVVVNEERVLLGLLRAAELDKDPAQLIEHAMRPGPSTFRPFVSIDDMAHFMVEHQLENVPVTTSDGRLVGLLLKQDVVSRTAEE